MTLFTVGPVQMSPEVREAGAIAIPYFRTAHFSQLMLDLEQIILQLFGAPEGSRSVFLSCSGSGAMEAAVASCFNEDDRLLIINGGGFGQRFEDIAKHHQIPFDVLRLPFEEDLTEAHLKPFGATAYKAVLVNHCETSIGKIYDLSLLGQWAHQHGAMLFVDAVSSFLNDPLDMESMQIDLALTTSQKALALAPGLSPVVMAPSAIEKLRQNQSKLFYHDLSRALNNMDRGQTPWTPSLGVIFQLEKRLKMIVEQGGLESELQRREQLSSYFRKQLSEQLPSYKIPTFQLSKGLTPVLSPNQLAKRIFTTLMDQEDMVVTPSGGDLADLLVRVGHMGDLYERDYDQLLQVWKKYGDFED